ncbi:transmembrane protein 43 homolog [Neocloeon triangulifer]|uniref:transmembrane protein 43 homolog n=1 Tax=Neocloeon triangulifer TaxID=2078957 RepID=UPI00286EFE8B|nr:transmembrane protein 43 homolog [Neocloeon triangulifer]
MRRNVGYNRLHQVNGHTYRQEDVQVNSKIKNRWFHIICGCLFFAFGFAILMWSEARLLTKTKSLNEGFDSIVLIQNENQILPENNGKLIHLVGYIQVGEPLTEFEYGVLISAVKLKRRVQMYQWVEERTLREFPEEFDVHQDGLFYYTEWRDKLNDHTRFAQPFGHENPREIPLKTKIYVSDQVNVGAYYFSDALKDLFTDFELFTSDERPENRDIKLHSGLYYHSQDVWNPKVGDTRVQFSYSGLAGEVVTIIAMQVDHELHPYITTHGDKILIFRHGQHSPKDFYLEHHKQHWLLSWIVRGACSLVLFVGSSFLTPLLKRFSRSKCSIGGIELVPMQVLTRHITSVNLCLSTSTSMCIIGFTWASLRPILATILFTASSMPLILLFLVSIRIKRD